MPIRSAGKEEFSASENAPSPGLFLDLVLIPAGGPGKKMKNKKKKKKFSNRGYSIA